MRFLITGASGLIGFALASRLAERYGIGAIQLILPPVDQNSTEKRRHERLMEAGFDIFIHDILQEGFDVTQIKPFDVLFHLAAFTETETDSSRVRTNDLGTKRLLNA